MRRALIGTIAGLALGLFASNASALEDPWTQEKIQIQGHFGGGIHIGDGDLNPYKFGLGVRGGYTLEMPIYIGGIFDFYFGENEGLYSANSLLFQAEGGYDLGLLDWLVLRPKLGIGLTRFKYEVCTIVLTDECADNKEARFTLAPGVEVPMKLGPVLVSPELRFNLAINGEHAMIIGAGAGAAF